MPNLIKDIVFDGTLYHLWYLPASIIGGGVAGGPRFPRNCISRENRKYTHGGRNRYMLSCRCS